MSYCRFSSDDYQCDVYVYESVYRGYVINVARSRIVFKKELPSPVSMKDTMLWLDRHNKIMDMVHAATREPIGLSNDGVNYCEETAEDCAIKLLDLKEEGYRVPQYAIDYLIEEQDEADGK